MRTRVEFCSHKFPAYPDEEEKINPNLWGKRLAEYLKGKLNGLGIPTETKIGFEDWGCRLDLIGTSFPVWIGCGRYQEHTDGYLCFIEPSKPMIWKFPFKRIDTTAEVARITDALDSILNSDPDIHGVRWWSENEK